MKSQIPNKQKKWNCGITNTNIKQNYQESKYLFCCNYEQSSQNNQCTHGAPSKVWEDFLQKKLLMRRQKLFWAKKLWGGCSKLDG